MSGDYPSETELQSIREWPHTDVHGLLDFILSIWHAPDWGWNEYTGKDRFSDSAATRVIHASTGGWSGNERIMGAFTENFLAFHQAFESYRRGGHYELSLPARKP